MPAGATLTEFFIQGGLFILLAVIGMVVMRGRVNLIWLGAAAALFAAEIAARTLGWGRLDFLDITPGSHAWEGAALSLLIVLIAAAAMTRGRLGEAGITLAQKGPARLFGWLVALVLLGLATAGGLRAPEPDPNGIAALAFDGVLSPLEIELVYRAVLLLALDRAFSTPVNVLGASMGWGGVMSAVLYTAAATSLFANPSFATIVDMQPAAILLPFALVLVWIRAATGSVLAPVLVHMWGEISFHVL